MAFKFVVFAACLAFANAGGLIAQPALLGTAYSAAPHVSHVYNSYGGYSNLADQHALGLSQQNILRTHGGTVSQISKQVISPHSSVSKSVTSINNDGYKTLAYAQPAIHASYAAPAIHTSYAAPIAHQTLVQPAHGYATHHGYAAHGYAAPIAHQTLVQPAIHSAYAAPIAHAAPLAVGHGAVVHASYASPIVNYGW